MLTIWSTYSMATNGLCLFDKEFSLLCGSILIPKLPLNLGKLKEDWDVGECNRSFHYIKHRPLSNQKMACACYDVFLAQKN
jgi:hypothetical protein